MEDSFDILKNKIQTAPAEIRDFIMSGKWSQVTGELAMRKELNSDQKLSLENEVLFVLAGMDTRDNFRTNLVNGGIPQNIANDIYSEVNSRIFKEIESFLPKEEVAGEPVGEPTLKSIPENKPETQEVAPMVVVETPKAEEKKPINLIPPAPPAPKPLDLAPANLPTAKPASVISEKLSQVVTSPSIKTTYPDGKDPYREPLN